MITFIFLVALIASVQDTCEDVVEHNVCNHCRCKGYATGDAVLFDTTTECFQAAKLAGHSAVSYLIKPNGRVKCLAHGECTNVKTNVNNDWHVSNLYCPSSEDVPCNPTNLVETIECTNCRCRGTVTSDAVVYANVQKCFDAVMADGYSTVMYVTKWNGVKCLGHSTCAESDQVEANNPWQISSLTCTLPTTEVETTEAATTEVETTEAATTEVETTEAVSISSSSPPTDLDTSAKIELFGSLTFEEIVDIESFLIECTIAIQYATCTAIENSVDNCSFTVTIESESSTVTGLVQNGIESSGLQLSTLGFYTVYTDECTDHCGNDCCAHSDCQASEYCAEDGDCYNANDCTMWDDAIDGSCPSVDTDAEK